MQTTLAYHTVLSKNLLVTTFVLICDVAVSPFDNIYRVYGSRHFGKYEGVGTTSDLHVPSQVGYGV